MVLNWGNNFELLIAIILSAQCTDKKVNEVTSIVFPKYRKERGELKRNYEEYKKILRSYQRTTFTERSQSQDDKGVTRAEGPADAQRNDVKRASAGGAERQDPD